MGALFGRRATVIIEQALPGGTTAQQLRIESLRVKFKVVKGLTAPTKGMNSLDATIYNLKATSRALCAKGSKVTLLAGYAGSEQIIFKGTIRTAEHRKETADWLTRIQAGDGEGEVGDAFTSTSFGPDAGIDKVVGKLASDLGVGLGNALDAVKSGNYTGALESWTGGIALHGQTAKKLDDVLDGAGLEWSIQDGELQVTEPGKPTTATAVVLSATTGLIGSPEVGEKGVVKITSLLQPMIRPGRLIDLRSIAIKQGLYRTAKVTHDGDTHGKNWFSIAEAMPK